MTKAKNPGQLLEGLLKESDAYSSMELIDNMIGQGGDLALLPIQPLYLAIKRLPVDKVSALLPRLSEEQRQAFLDLDLWIKDELDVESFTFWPKVYALSDDEDLRLEFAKSSNFLLYLKGRFNVWTFDIEDPVYPDHDNYFLTDDNLLLFEYDGDFEYVHEVQQHIRELYSHWGVEAAYTYLFKMVSDSSLSLQEEEFQLKRERLRDYGFVDYYDALELEEAFLSLDLLHNFIRKKRKITGQIDEVGGRQALHGSSLIAYKDNMDDFSSELNKVESEKRIRYLHFNFIRLVNASLALNHALKDGPVAMTRIGQSTRYLMLLGFNYLQDIVKKGEVLKLEEGESLFERFEFTDLYRLGNGLIKIEQRRLKKSLQQHKFDKNNESFLGRYWGEFLDSSFLLPMKISFSRDQGEKPFDIVRVNDYIRWRDLIDQFISLLPYAQNFYVVFKDLKDSGKLHSDYYLNYTVEEIDLEAILMSSFANFCLGNLSKDNSKKMGLTIDEMLNFMKLIIDEKGNFINRDKIEKMIKDFSKSFGLDQMINLQEYFLAMLNEHLEGYEMKKLNAEDFKHIGGPIILNVL